MVKQGVARDPCPNPRPPDAHLKLRALGRGGSGFTFIKRGKTSPPSSLSEGKEKERKSLLGGTRAVEDDGWTGEVRGFRPPDEAILTPTPGSLTWPMGTFVSSRRSPRLCEPRSSSIWRVTPSSDPSRPVHCRGSPRWRPCASPGAP